MKLLIPLMHTPAADLSTIRDLYGRGLYRQALAAGEPLGPLRAWAGPAARLLAGRLAIQLGAPTLGRRLHLATFRGSPAFPEAIYYHARYRLERFGPLSAWEFAAGHPDWTDAGPELRADWLALTALALARLRDFDRADKRLAQAEATAPNRAWVHVERAGVLEAADKPDEAMAAARRALEIQPWFRPGVQAVAHLLHRGGRESDAIDFLTEAAGHLESGIVLAQLAGMQLEQNRPADARRSLERYVELSPLLEPDAEKWLAARRTDVAYLLGEFPVAAAEARKVGDDFYTGFADTLEQHPPAAPTRTMLGVELAYDGDPPTPHDLLAAFWKQPPPPAGEPGPPSLDGLPDHAERHRYDSAGWLTREFTLTADAAFALAGRGLPFFVTPVEGGFGQARLVVGADPTRGSLFLADGSERRPGEAPAAVLTERYKASGPRCLVAVPKAEAAKLDGLTLPDAGVFDRLHAIQRALSGRDFRAAKDATAKLRADHPGHRITKQAAVAWARATAHPVLLLDAIDALLADFPHDPTLVLTKAAALRELGRVPERLALLEAEGSAADADPLLTQSLAQMLLPDPHRTGEADRLLRRSLRARPGAAAGYFLLGSLRWERQRFAEAVDLYRLAACLDDREDQFAEAYWKVARARDQVPEALRLFQQKATRAAVPSPPAVRALFTALLDRDEPEQAFGALGKAVEKLKGTTEPALPELLLFRAEQHANFGRFAEAEADLAAAKPVAPAAQFHKAAARVARTKPDYTAALGHVRDLLAAEPLNAEGHRIAAALIADTEGRAAARAYVGELAHRFPDVYPLARLRAEMLYREPDDSAVLATRNLLDLCPHDAWAHRQLALVFADRRRHDEALAATREAAKTEPEHPSHFAVLGHVHRKADRIEDAIEAFRAGVRSFPDHELCIHELGLHARGLKEKKAALRFVAETLHARPFTGDGLVAYFEQSVRLIDDPEEQERFHAELERFLDERPDLWQCWSLVAQHLVGTHRAEEAVSLAQDAVVRFPLSAKLWYDLAEACEATNRPEERLDALRQALATAPGWPPVAKELADALAAADDHAGAAAVLRRAVARNPLDPSARWLLAEQLWEAGESEDALEQAKAAVRHEPVYDPDRPPSPDVAWSAVNVWSDRLDRPDEPLAFARSLACDRAGDPRAWLRLVRVLSEPDHADEALAALDKAIALDPRNVDAYDQKAEKLAHLGRFDEALEAAHPEALAGDLPLSLQGRAAWVEAKRGNYAAAIPPMQALVAVDPEYTWGWQQLAEWYNDTGRPQNYLEAASELCRLRPDSPFPLAMRGEAKVQTGDRDGGKADLREALRIHPGYSPAAAVLFDACLADDELKEARTALAVLQEYLVGPEVLVKQVQYAARTGDADGAARAYREICEHPGDGPPLFLQMATAEMRAADLMDKAEELLRGAWQSGEPFNPWASIFWLDTPEAEAAPLDDRLAAIDAAVKHNPRFVPAHDRRAEQLAAAGRFDEAAAACTPPGVEPLPVALRGRLAWVEALRGDREKAIEAMAKVVAEEPDYTWGWRQLERWYDALGRLRDRLDAADQLVRLNPTDPLALGIRGEARRAVGDHRGAAEDLRRAFELDPSFDAAGLQLVSAQLATDDLSGAARTLSTLREHADGPLVKLRAVQIAARQGDLGAARKGFQALGKDEDASRPLLREAANALADAGWAAEADEDLDQLTADPAVTPAAAGLWAERLLTTGNTEKVADRLGGLAETNRPAAREAAVTYAWGMAVLGRPDAASATVQRYAELIREDDDGWGRAGAALAAAKQWGLAAAWLGDWKDRPERTPWMLRPLADALRALGRDAEADDLAAAAVEMSPPGEGPAEFRAWLAVSAAVAGDAAAAAAHLRAVDPLGESDGVKLLVAVADALVRVQQATATEKSAAFADAKARLQDAAGACEAKDVPPGLARWWPRVASRLAADAGTLSATLWAWWQRVAPWVREG